ncbi:MAG: hypothetical protein BJ554DRAFT_5739 [Olpidium bornovanus]|uniref:Uncharacterized protein n=1 Tax=Olpidium bornovanus TaxID=278681 RepID=A0A8H7ZZR4_9FUNG|nr:MAG: hypothetical protein BJ554DRAFT_5739 [Olpidium bornovanus]
MGPTMKSSLPRRLRWLNFSVVLKTRGRMSLSSACLGLGPHPRPVMMKTREKQHGEKQIQFALVNLIALRSEGQKSSALQRGDHGHRRRQRFFKICGSPERKSSFVSSSAKFLLRNDINDFFTSVFDIFEHTVHRV